MTPELFGDSGYDELANAINKTDDEVQILRKEIAKIESHLDEIMAYISAIYQHRVHEDTCRKHMGRIERAIARLEKKAGIVRIYDTDLPGYLQWVLRQNGIETMEELAQKTRGELMALDGFGKKSLIHVEEKLAQYGLKLRESK